MLFDQRHKVKTNLRVLQAKHELRHQQQVIKHAQCVHVAAASCVYVVVIAAAWLLLLLVVIILTVILAWVFKHLEQVLLDQQP